MPSRKKILVVSPHFAPSNAADSHRVRLLLPFLSELGWDADILAIRPEQVSSPIDPWLSEGIPDNVGVHRVSIWDKPWRYLPGLGTTDYRAMPAMRATGDRLLASQKFDLVFFSTTVFALHQLGVRWKRKFGVPFVMDYQDLWTTDFYHRNNIRPPGGWLKYNVSATLASYQQRSVLKACDGIVAVTSQYFDNLAREHSHVKSIPVLGLPFPASQSDWDRITKSPIQQPFFTKSTGTVDWVYVGVCGPIMHKALKAILQAVARFRHQSPQPGARLRLHFLGTSYAPAGTGVPTVKPIANELGIGDMVQEVTDRIPYSQALQCLQDADALIVPGTNDPAYTASKIYSYLITRKPLLAVFREESSVCSLIDRVGGANCVKMSEESNGQHLADEVFSHLSLDPPFVPQRQLNAEAFDQYNDHSSAVKLDSFFRTVIDAANHERKDASLRHSIS